MILYIRHGLGVLRLLLLFVLICWLVWNIRLDYLDWSARGAGLTSLPLPQSSMTSPPPFLGVNIALEQRSPREQQVALARLTDSGFGWVRQRFDWGKLEPQPGAFVWSESDGLLAAVDAAKLMPVVVLDGSPAWARAEVDAAAHNNPLAPPGDPADFARFAAAFAARYRNQVRYYQIWDEPNIAPHWGNRHIEPVAYAQLLKVASAAIRTADPDAQIMAAALAPTVDRGHTALDEIYFLQRLYAAGAATAFDAVALQPLGFGYTSDDARERLDLLNFQRVKLVRRAMLAAGDGATPIWIVRYGWNRRADSLWGTVSAANQIQFAVRALDIAYQQWPWVAAMGWAIDQPAQSTGHPFWGFALYDDLRQSLHEWSRANSDQRPEAPPTSGAPWRLVGLFLFGLVAIAYSWQTMRALPWPTWFQCYRTWPVAMQILFWLALGWLYYAATWSPLIVLCWLLAALLLAAQPLTGLFLAILLLPFYFQHKELPWADIRWTIAPAQALLLALAPSLLRRWFKELYSKLCVASWWAAMHNLSASDWLALSWLALNLTSAVQVWYWPAYWQGLIDLALTPLLLYLAARLLLEDKQQRQQALVAAVLGGVWVAWVGLVDWAQGGSTLVDGVRRLTGPYFSPNHAALYLERAFFVAVGLGLSTSAFASQAGMGGYKPHLRWGVWVAAGLIGGALLLTASRGAWLLGLPAGFVLIFWLGQGRYGLPLGRRGWMGLVGALLLIGLLAATPMAERLANRITVESRFAVWQASTQLWLDSLWLGVGAGGFFWRYPAYAPLATVEPNLHHPHQLWLEYATGWGVLGLLWLLLWLRWLVAIAWSLRSPTAQPVADKSAFVWLHWRFVNPSKGQEQLDWLQVGLLASLVAALAHAQVDTFAILADLAAWNWLTLALLTNKQGAPQRDALSASRASPDDKRTI
jgi:O-antigen ligase